MPAYPTVTLNDGSTVPQLGLGVFKVPNDEAVDAVSTALAQGYRLIDTAAMYGNEAGVGEAIAKSGIPREDIVVTTKLNNNAHGYESTLDAFEVSRKALGVDRVDVYLIHWPLPSRNQYVQSWRAFIDLQRDGAVRTIGVSNFQPDHLERVMDETGVVPALNQIELHPYLTQSRLRQFHAAHGIVTEAWSPIARGGELLRDPAVVRIAQRHQRTAAQVVIRWHVQLGNVVIPKSVRPARIAENADVFGFELSADEVAAISALDRGHRTGPNPDTFNPW